MNRLGILVLALGVFFAGLAPALAIKPAHKKAALELIEALNMKQQHEDGLEQMINVQMEANPGLRAYRHIMKEFLVKYMGWDALKDDIVRVFADAFTRKEMKKLTKFYTSKLGQKAAKKVPELSQTGAMIGMQRVQANMAELDAKMREAGAVPPGGRGGPSGPGGPGGPGGYPQGPGGPGGPGGYPQGPGGPGGPGGYPQGPGAYPSPPPGR